MNPSNDHHPARSSRTTWTDERVIKQLFTHFDRLMQSPASVQRLRRFILDLAVRGKLVPQDPNDEPASELLKRIAKKKRQMEKVDGRKKQKSISTLTEQDLPFALPTNWKWGQIAEIGLLSPRNEAADDVPASFIPMPMIPATYGATCRHEVRQWGDIKKGYTHFVEGDVGLAKITPCFQNGKSVVFRNLTGGMGSGTTELHVVRPIFVDPDFITLFLKCPHFIETGIPKMTGTAGQKRVPTEYFAHSPFPLPPLPEQRRIVAKVNELMALCDQLEATQTKRETRRTHLAATSLARLNTPDPDQATFRKHVAFTLENITPLTTRPDQIKNLRQTILNLAVRGKLVPQDPNDEPASELLEQIAKKKARLVKAGAIRRQRRLPSIDEIPYSIPASWCWTRIREITSDRGQCVPEATFTYIDVTSIDKEKGKVAGPKVLQANEAPSRARKVVQKGDVIYSCVRPYLLNVAVVEDDFDPKPISSTAFAILNGHKLVLPRYLWIVLRSPFMVSCVEENMRGQAYPAINDTDFSILPFPLPPLPEQRRIVAKVDKLLELCDRLEASLAAGDDGWKCMLGTVLKKTLGPA